MKSKADRCVEAVLAYGEAQDKLQDAKRYANGLECNWLDKYNSDDFDPEHDASTNCLNKLYERMSRQTSKQKFSEAVEEHRGTAICERCYSSYKFRRGPLLTARRQFGARKGWITKLAKQIARDRND